MEMESCSDNRIPKFFLSLNDEDRKSLLDSAIPQNIKHATNNRLKVVNNYLKTKRIVNDMDKILTLNSLHAVGLLYSEEEECQTQ